ncbi:hypothetical protein [Rickettsiella massiliensis]|nr:hypothetical protein [Rickettsiella massiliensis]
MLPQRNLIETVIDHLNASLSSLTQSHRSIMNAIAHLVATFREHS